jgi:hypothetical protein
MCDIEEIFAEGEVGKICIIVKNKFFSSQWCFNIRLTDTNRDQLLGSNQRHGFIFMIIAKH